MLAHQAANFGQTGMPTDSFLRDQLAFRPFNTDLRYHRAAKSSVNSIPLFYQIE